MKVSWSYLGDELVIHMNLIIKTEDIIPLHPTMHNVDKGPSILHIKPQSPRNESNDR